MICRNAGFDRAPGAEFISGQSGCFVFHVIDALESGGLLYGTEPQPGVVFDASGRLPNTQFDRALSDFDEPTRKQVISVLSQVGALA
jgi:hypothetical protein